MAPKRGAGNRGSPDEDGERHDHDQTQPSKKKQRLARLEEYEEDIGRARSRDFQKWAKVFENFGDIEAKRSAKFLGEFREDVQEREAELKAYRQKKQREFEAGQQKFASMFKVLFGKHDRQLCTLCKEDHPLFQQVQDFSADHHSLLKQASLIEKQLGTNNLRLPEVDFNQDRSGFRDVLARSVAYGVALVERILAPKLKLNTILDQPATSKADQLAKEILDGNQGFLEGESWGYVADAQVNHFRAVAAMAAPEDEADFVG
ncbi:hypothetical protein F5Y17DRAFT_343491 [Xylariaceae sp. FL0594]|nr:hypothetical protein F5Y17DRAFT_343491 [Xylariaceae sp. FL0594]